MAKNLIKNIIYIIAIFFLIAVVFSPWMQTKEQPKTIGLTELVSQINQEKIDHIIVNGSDLEITAKDNSKEISRKEDESSLTDTLKNYGVDPQKLDQVQIEIQNDNSFKFWGTIIITTILPILIIGFFLWYMLRQAQRGANQAFLFTKSMARVIMPEDDKGIRKVTFKDVAGLKEAKEELMEIVEFLKSPQKFIKMGAKIPKGVLLIGPPGCGKTLLAKAVANEANVPFFNISGSEFIELFVGVGSARVRDLFRTAKKNAPCLVFVDELDAIGRHRGAGLGGGHDEREQTLNQILVEMDGFEPNSGVVVISATNRPDILDPALLRPGRFDRRVLLDLPDINDREQILRVHGQDKPMENNVDLRQIAERTPGFSGADLANLMNEAAILAARKNKKSIGQLELIDSIEKVLLGPERKSHILSLKEKEITAYHEAGHALVAHILPNVDPVRKISIIARGRAAGYTLKLPIEDKHLHSRSEFLEELSVLLAGFTSEKLVFNEITTGAANDLERASDLARQIVTQYGMSEKIGPITFGNREEMVFLGKEIATEKDYSEKVATEIDEEVSRLIHDAQRNAAKIITEKRNLLNKIAQRLIEKETIEKEEFEELMKEVGATKTKQTKSSKTRQTKAADQTPL
ncbi:MAG: cell division protein FtsH [Candidatus Portnoybacteria bacterium CG_4_10_14_0_2_um_filter_44_20]|uniref:ATP-dependent zinc metalloprotease FtsH n=2 Tax=Candidatus Portnoyibacteriota TaxID=1817913 RepID=A0A2M7YKD4_9BACT|nr:MAG: cell division protein FtsH [Parcubacteria group bacterium CG2_30_44_18]PIZ71784.1 MAG: cell division protein FtsH [Candidatus Portnoybacteria bacterium CG_4_10_14_0_2_um_filter_44_20]PJA63439.1 MAG: cell division protein FtsH [Candidatus Portnoybacteria bacterium CG_4_9_14_3_um_filter_44_9]